MVRLRFRIRFLRQMTPAARRHPRRVTRVTRHLFVGVRDRAVCVANRFRVRRPFVVARIAGRDGVFHLHDFPLNFGRQHRALKEASVDPRKASTSGRCRSESQISSA